MYITSVSKPRWADADHTILDVDVTYDNLEGSHGFTSVDGYGEPHVQAVWDMVVLNKELGEIAPYSPPLLPETTPEEERALMPQLSMVDFRRKLRGIKVIQRLDGDGNPLAELDGIYEADILEKIDLIADKELAAEARDYFLYAQYIERINPWVEILGSMFDITPEDIDTFWMA